MLSPEEVAARDKLVADVRKTCRQVYTLFINAGDDRRWVAAIQYPEYHQHRIEVPPGIDCFSDAAKQHVIAYLQAHQVMDAAEFAVFLEKHGNIWLGRKWSKHERRYLNDEPIWSAVWNKPSGVMFLGFRAGKWWAAFEETVAEDALPEGGIGCDPLTAVEDLAASVRKYGESWIAGADQILFQARRACDPR